MSTSIYTPARPSWLEGSGGGNCSQYWIENDGKPLTSEENAIKNQMKPPYKVPSMEQIRRMPPNGMNVCSTFSGCGGSSLGYKMAGYRVLWANEFIPAAQETYEANHPTTILDKRDIREVQPQDILDATGLSIGELDLFDGSPPCKDFSLAGNRDWESGKVKSYSDTKQRTDDLFAEYVRLLAGLQPKAFVAENVAGMTVGKAKEFLGGYQRDMFAAQEKTVVDMLMDAGYVVRYQVLDAQHFGVPQARRRIIFMGVRKDLAIRFKIESRYPVTLPYTYTVRDAISWIAKVYDGKETTVDASEVPAPTIRGEDGGRSSSSFDQGLSYVEAQSDLARYATGVEWDNLSIGEQSEKYFNLIKASPDKPCPTICASHGSPGIASTTHPFEKRKWSIAELKRICGFPDDFILTGTYQKQWERLGRAVPPVMMAHIGRAVLEHILRKAK